MLRRIQQSASESESNILGLFLFVPDFEADCEVVRIVPKNTENAQRVRVNGQNLESAGYVRFSQPGAGQMDEVDGV